MFGKNQVTKPFRDQEGRLLVNEIWYTIQGEGPDAGRPAVFVRLSKCNLRCYFCDTEFESGTLLTCDEIGARIVSMRGPSDLVVITGGEPLLQNIVPLAKVCNTMGMDVSVETAGTVYYDELLEVFAYPHRNKIVCSPKTSQINRDLLTIVAAFKYIIQRDQISDHDGLPSMSTQMPGIGQRIFRPGHSSAAVYVQPMDEGNEVLNAANLHTATAIAMKHGYRLSVQMHKIAGVP